MSSPTKLSDFEDNLLPNDRDDADDLDAGGYASDETIKDSNFWDDNNATADTKKRKIDPATGQKRRATNPQPKLDAERLKGPKGIHTIEQHFENFKFRGKGYEKNDLNLVIKKLEYWSHRLFPKFEFDDCLAKLEVLGTKKPVQTHLKKIRLGILIDDDVVLNEDKEEDEMVVEDSAPLDEFDALIAEQLKKQTQSVIPHHQNNSCLATSSSETSKRVADALPKNPTPLSDIHITVDMKERMERNRQIAMQKRLARIEAEEARKKTLKNQGEKDETPISQENDA